MAEQTATTGAAGRTFKIGYLASLDDTPAGGAPTPRFSDIRALAQAAETAGLDSF